MARLDVTEVLFDPDFMDTTLSVIRNTQTIGNDGIAVNAQSTTFFAGVVTSDNGAVLTRLPEGERLSDTITIHTVYRLSNGQTGISADIVNWQGKQWTVSTVNAWGGRARPGLNLRALSDPAGGKFETMPPKNGGGDLEV